MGRASLCHGFGRSELRGLEVVLGAKGPCLVAKVGLSVTVVAACTEAVAVAVGAPIASVLRVSPETFWSVEPTVIPVSEAAEVTPAGAVPVPAVIVTTATAP